MTEKRSSDKNTQRIEQEKRANRGYEINKQWYFELRGGGQKGPFESKKAMQTELNEFINLYEEMNNEK